jgi:hypothetical protein
MSTMVITGSPSRARHQVRPQVRPQVRSQVHPQAAPQRHGAGGAGEVRLTRRGRLLVTMVLTALVLVAFLAAGGASVATRDAGEPTPIRTIEVERGQTLWAIASEIAEPGQVREMVYTIERLNSLPDATLTEGQMIAVPAR